MNETKDTKMLSPNLCIRESNNHYPLSRDEQSTHLLISKLQVCSCLKTLGKAPNFTTEFLR